MEPGIKFVQALPVKDANRLFKGSSLYNKYKRLLIDERNNNPYASPPDSTKCLLEVPWSESGVLADHPDDPVSQYLRTAYEFLDIETCIRSRELQFDNPADEITIYLMELFEKRYEKPSGDRLAIKKDAQTKFPGYITLKNTTKPNNLHNRTPYLFTKQYISPNKCHGQRWVAFGLNQTKRIVGHSSLYLAPRLQNQANQSIGDDLIWATLAMLNSLIVECFLRLDKPIKRKEGRLHGVTTAKLNPIPFPFHSDYPQPIIASMLDTMAQQAKDIYKIKERLTSFDHLFKSKLIHLAQMQGPPCECSLSLSRQVGCS